MKNKADLLLLLLLSIAVSLEFWVLYEQNKPSVASAQTCLQMEGGYYTTDGGAGCVFANPYTGGCSCPAGFSGYFNWKYRSSQYVHACLPF